MQTPASPPPGALHAVVRSQFQYMAFTRTSENEFWVSGGNLWRKHDGKVAPAPEPALSAAPAPVPEDLHTAGFDYEPEFLWKVADTAETRVIHGRQCRLTTATGIAAYSQTELRLWLCPARAADESKVTGLVAETAGGQDRSVAAFVAGEMGRRTGIVLLALEETTEPAIAPVIVRKTETVVLDSEAVKQ